MNDTVPPNRAIPHPCPFSKYIQLLKTTSLFSEHLSTMIAPAPLSVP